MKGVRALRGYFAPPPHIPMRQKKKKNENCFSQVSSYKFIRTIAQVLKSDFDSIFTVAMVTEMAAKIG